MCHSIIQKCLDSRICLKVIFNIFCSFFSANTQVLRQSKRTDPIYNTEIDRFRISSLKWSYLFKRNVKYLRSCNSMNILFFPVSLDQICVTGTMCQHTKFNLRIIGIHKNVSVLRHKYLPDQPSQFYPDRNILKIRLRAADPSGRCNCLIELAVDSSIFFNIIDQTICIRRF